MKGGIFIPYVPVPKDLTTVKTKVAFNLTKRQLICFGLAAAVAVPTYFLTRGALGTTRGYDACNRGLAVLLPRYVRKGRTAGRKDFKKLYTVKIFDAESQTV